jgi:hypothetical protein
MPQKSAASREQEITRLQAQLLLQLGAAKVMPTDAFQNALQAICRKYAADGVEVRQTFDVTGFSYNIQVWLNNNRQSLIVLVKK